MRDNTKNLFAKENSIFNTIGKLLIAFLLVVTVGAICWIGSANAAAVLQPDATLKVQAIDNNDDLITNDKVGFTHNYVVQAGWDFAEQDAVDVYQSLDLDYYGFEIGFWIDNVYSQQYDGVDNVLIVDMGPNVGLMLSDDSNNDYFQTANIIPTLSGDDFYLTPVAPEDSGYVFDHWQVFAPKINITEESDDSPLLNQIFGQDAETKSIYSLDGLSWIYNYMGTLQTVLPINETTIQAVFKEQPKSSGTLTDSSTSKNPIPDAFIGIYGLDTTTTFAEGKTDNVGKYDITLPNFDDNENVRVVIAADGYYSYSETKKWSEWREDPLAGLTLEKFSGTDTITISGELQEKPKSEQDALNKAAGGSIGNATIMFVSKDTDKIVLAYTSSYTAEDGTDVVGHFSMKLPKNIEGTVYASADGYTIDEPLVLSSDDTKQDITVNDDDDPDYPLYLIADTAVPIYFTTDGVGGYIKPVGDKSDDKKTAYTVNSNGASGQFNQFKIDEVTGVVNTRYKGVLIADNFAPTISYTRNPGYMYWEWEIYTLDGQRISYTPNIANNITQPLVFKLVFKTSSQYTASVDTNKCSGISATYKSSIVEGEQTIKSDSQTISDSAFTGAKFMVDSNDINQDLQIYYINDDKTFNEITTIKAPAREGYFLDHWTVKADGGQEITITTTTSVTVAPNTEYTVTPVFKAISAENCKTKLHFVSDDPELGGFTVAEDSHEQPKDAAEVSLYTNLNELLSGDQIYTDMSINRLEEIDWLNFNEQSNKLSFNLGRSQSIDMLMLGVSNSDTVNINDKHTHFTVSPATFTGGIFDYWTFEVPDQGEMSLDEFKAYFEANFGIPNSILNQITIHAHFYKTQTIKGNIVDTKGNKSFPTNPVVWIYDEDMNFLGEQKITSGNSFEITVPQHDKYVVIVSIAYFYSNNQSFTKEELEKEITITMERFGQSNSVVMQGYTQYLAGGTNEEKLGNCTVIYTTDEGKKYVYTTSLTVEKGVIVQSEANSSGGNGYFVLNIPKGSKGKLSISREGYNNWESEITQEMTAEGIFVNMKNPATGQPTIEHANLTQNEGYATVRFHADGKTGVLVEPGNSSNTVVSYQETLKTPIKYTVQEYTGLLTVEDAAGKQIGVANRGLDGHKYYNWHMLDLITGVELERATTGTITRDVVFDAEFAPCVPYKAYSEDKNHKEFTLTTTTADYEGKSFTNKGETMEDSIYEGTEISINSDKKLVMSYENPIDGYDETFELAASGAEGYEVNEWYINDELLKVGDTYTVGGEDLLEIVCNYKETKPVDPDPPVPPTPTPDPQPTPVVDDTTTGGSASTGDATPFAVVSVIAGLAFCATILGRRKMN